MKWKIIWLNISTVFIAILLVTLGFFSLINIREINTVQDVLRSYNNFLINYDNINQIKTEKLLFNNTEIRITLVNKNGEVIFDSIKGELDNHKTRYEISKAFEKGEFETVRSSDTQNSQVVYVATKINDEYVLRSSLKIKDINIFYGEYLWYYLIVVCVVIILTITLSMKLVRSILYPISQLEEMTSKIAKGDFSKRVKIINNNEIGGLAKTFNSMADRLEERIEDSQDKKGKLECILESMDSGVVAIDDKGEIILINPYAKNIFNIKNDVIGKNIKNFISDNRIIDFMLNIPVLNNIEIATTLDTEKVLKLKKAPIIQTESYPIGTVIVLSDITDVRKLEMMRSQFVANVSHELKTPLTSIKGFAETLKYVKDEEKKEKFLNIIEKEADRLTGLINDILLLSKVENATSMINEEFSVSEIIEQAISIVEVLAKEKNIQIHKKLEYNKNIRGDKNKFYQVVLNLLENAVKYSDKDSLVKISTSNEENSLILKIEDNGKGIAKEELPRIFERFYRVDKARGSTGISGTGLGLSIVKHIVKMFNGEIFVESELGKGSIFKIKI